MTNYTFNKINANDIANKIIENEESYLKIDLDSLSFEDKCYFVLHNNKFNHIRIRTEEEELKVLNSLLPELNRRADAGDPLAMYYLSAFYPATAETYDSDEHRALIKRAIDAGSLEAKIYFIDCRFAGDSDEVQKLIADMPERLATGTYPEKVVFNGYQILSERAPSKEERNRYAKILYEMAVSLAESGQYFVLTHLRIRNVRAKNESDKLAPDDERDFWSTVDFLAEWYFFETYGYAASDLLGIKLIRGIGCEPDLTKAKRVYLSLYSKRHVNLENACRILKISGSDAEALAEAQQRFVADVQNGDVEGYWKQMLLAAMTNDMATVERICDEAIERHPDDLMRILPKAYTKIALSK